MESFQGVLKILGLESHVADILGNLPLLVGPLSSLLGHVLSCAEILWVLLDCGCFSFEGIQIWKALFLASDLNGIIPHNFRIQRQVCAEKLIYSLVKGRMWGSTTHYTGRKLH